jgi:hypothetical protein
VSNSQRDMIAAAAQREYEDSITTEGRVAHAEYLGQRIAVAVMGLFDTVITSTDPPGPDDIDRLRARATPAKVDPGRVIAALEQAGFERVGGRAGGYSRHRVPGSEPARVLVVPLDRTAPEYGQMMADVLAKLASAVKLGRQAAAVLDAAGLSSGADPPGPLDGWDECAVPGCPSWDDNADPDAVDEFEDSEVAHGVRHVLIVDHYLVPAPSPNGT